MALRDSLQALRSTPFRLLAAGQGLSWLGDALVTVALAVAIIQRGGTASDLGVVIGTGMASRLAFMLLGGVWADRLRPQPLMILCDLVRAVAQVLLALEFTHSRPSVGALCGLYVVSGGAAAFFRPALASLQPLVVPIEQRHAANAFMGLLQSGANVAGPALAGVRHDQSQRGVRRQRGDLRRLGPEPWLGSGPGDPGEPPAPVDRAGRGMVGGA